MLAEVAEKLDRWIATENVALRYKLQLEDFL
jgi:hypothetical protein